jgi:hypothetical protein
MTLGLGNAIPDPRIRPPRPNRAPVPSTQRVAHEQQTEQRQQDINSEILAFQADLRARCASMANKFGLSERYSQDLLLAAGVHTIYARPDGNSYNGFLSMKAKEIQDSMSLPPLSSFILTFCV